MDKLEKNFSTFFLNNNVDTQIDISFKHTSKDEIEIINDTEYNMLISIKNKIDLLEDTKLWDKVKKISNDFELVYLPNKKLKSNSVSKYEPLSRSYFKLWEIINDFNLLNVEVPIKMAGLAEGPGGFIEAMINYRKKFKNTCLQDKVYGITLRSVDKDIPGWTKASHFLKKNPNVNISYGKDGTGNIYNLDNIVDFSKFLNNNATLITADGGFDFSTNFNKQEQSSLQIIFCEIVMALSIQKKGGSFVCKIYDSYTRVSLSFLYLLHSLYTEVHITKPYTSRPANSEKYLVCKGFKGIDEKLLKKLHIIVKSWELIDNNGDFIYQIIDWDKIPDNFKAKVHEFNSIYYNQQTKNILKTLKLIELFSTNSDYDQSELHKNIVKYQTHCAFLWCKKYKCKINYDSDYLKDKNSKIKNTISQRKIKVI